MAASREWAQQAAAALVNQIGAARSEEVIIALQCIDTLPNRSVRETLALLLAAVRANMGGGR